MPQGAPNSFPMGSFQRPVVPPTVDPFQEPLKYIPINCEWLPYIAGSLFQLLLESTWLVDTVPEMELVIQRAGTLLSAINCVVLPTLSDLQGVPGSGDCEDCMCCLRVQNGILQTLQCGVWTDVPGQPPGGFFPIPQPGDNQQLPRPGECTQYHATMPGSGIWLLPVGVSTGDTLEVTGIEGVSFVGGHGEWFCGDGSEFILGICTSLSVLDAFAPRPDLKVGRLIAKIGAAFYDVIDSTFVVPGGISNEQVEFQVNSAMLSQNNGSLVFDVLACNNQSDTVTITYSHGSGLTSAPYGTTFLVTAQDIGTDVRIDMAFDHPVKLTVVGQSGYVNTGTPGLGDVWAGWTLGGTQVGTLADPPNTLPTDFPSPQVVDALGMDTGAPGAVFTITVRIDHP